MEKTTKKAENRAWVDAADVEAEATLPAFQKSGREAPSWAITDARREEMEGEEEALATSSTTRARPSSSAHLKRHRSEDLEALLTRTEPLLASKRDATHAAAPHVLSVLPLPRDAARSINWHRNNQVAVVGGNHHVYTFHAAGTFVELLSKVDVVQQVEATTLTASGEEVVVVGHEAYVPQLLSLASERVSPLNFLDARRNGIFRNGRRDNTKQESYITKVVARPKDLSTQMLAVASGSSLQLASLASGSIVSSISLDRPVADAHFTSATELMVASGNTIAIYDLRKTARFVRSFVDDGALSITAFAISASRSTLAVGNSSGMVHVLDMKSDASALSATRTTKVLKNLSTPISSVVYGNNRHGEEVVAFCTKGQKAGFRLAVLPDYHVVPAFPAISTRHQFIQSMELTQHTSILSVGERQKVTNYAI